MSTAWTPTPRQRRRMAVARRRRLRAGILAGVATVVVLGVLLTGLLLSPGWPTVRATFLDWGEAKAALPAVAEGFWLNVRLFCLAEVLILVLGLVVAAVRSTTGAATFPLRMIAVVYTDVFRGLPTLLVVYAVCFGVPALRLAGVTTSLFWLGLVALVLSYGAYVAEVFRSGIDSVHPSQVASAKTLGLSHAQTLRHVLVPQAVRRVMPPLLNDFVSLQKDTALLGTVGVAEALSQASDRTAYTFNFTPLVVAGAFFVLLCVPMARLTDAVGRRAMRRQWAGAR